MTILHVDDRAYLVEHEQQRYSLGDPADPLLVLNAVDGEGVSWVAEEPAGWDAPSVDLPIDRRQDGHGGIPGEPTYEERVLTVTGSAEAPDLRAALRARQRLLTAWSTAVRSGEEVLYSHVDEEPARSLWVLPTGRPRIEVSDGRWVDFSFVLVAGDPIKRGQEATYGPIRLVGTEPTNGRSYDASGRSYGAGGRRYSAGVVSSTAGATVAVVANAGDEDADASYRITGPVPRPVIQLATGERFALLLDLAALDEAVVDTESGTVYVNGTNRSDAIAPGSSFPLIPPGGVEVRLLSSAGATDPAAALYVTTAPRWT